MGTKPELPLELIVLIEKIRSNDASLSGLLKWRYFSYWHGMMCFVAL